MGPLELLFSSLIVFNLPDLHELDDFLGREVFVEAFHEGDESTYQSRSCVGPVCDAVEYRAEVIALDAQSASVAIFDRRSVEISRSTVALSDWERLAHNRVREKMASMQSFGFRIALLASEASRKAIAVNGRTRSVETRKVKFAGESAGGLRTVVHMEVAAGLGAVGQVLSSSETKPMGVDSTRLRSIVRP